MQLRSRQVKDLTIEFWTGRILFELILICLIGVIFASSYSRLGTIGLILCVTGTGFVVDVLAASIGVQVQNAISQITMDFWQDILTNRIAMKDAANRFKATNEISFDFPTAQKEATDDIVSFLKANELSDKMDTSPAASWFAYILTAVVMVGARIGLGFAASIYIVPLL